ncbi:hypothetical protein [Devosia sp. CAU 1758]
MGFRIFRHAVRMVFSQLGDALRISALLYIVTFAVSVGLAFLAASQAPVPAPGTPATLTWDSAVSTVVSVVLYLWIAVGWHRFVLLNEQPNAVLPQVHGDRMLAYLGRLVQTFLVLLLPAIVVVFLVISLAMAMGGNEIMVMLLSIVTIFVMTFVSYRLSPMLPGAAVGQGLGVAEAWKTTRGTGMAILGLAIVSAIAAVAIDIPGTLMLSQSNGLVFGLIWLALSGWVKLIVGVSIITTLYGVYVEKRTIA